jgi:hypothetical protein
VGIVSVVALLCLLVTSLIYWRERMLFIDAPHILFRIINDGTLQVTEHRYGSFITQVVPWVGVKLHFSLKSIMLLYSVSFYLFYLSIMSLLVFRYRAYTAAVVLALYYTLLVSDTFYWPNNEVHQGIAWLALAYTLLSRSLRKEQLRPLQIVLPAILFFIAIWTHPLVGIIAIYVLPFALRTVYKHRKPLALAVAAVVVGLVAVKWYQGMHHGYDSAKIETVTTFDFHHVASVFTSLQFGWFLRNCVANYWLFTFIALTGFFAAMKKKDYAFFGWALLFTLGYLVLICITFPEVGDRFYMESEYAPLSIIVAVPFVWYVLPWIRGKYSIVGIALIFCVRFVYIVSAAPLFKERLVKLDATLADMKQHGFTKAIVLAHDDQADKRMVLSWGLPVESMMLSALEGERPQRTFFYSGEEDLTKTIAVGRDTLIGCWEKRPTSKLNARYFQMDTTSGYKPMITAE